MNTLPSAVHNIFDRQGMATLRSGAKSNDAESLRQVAQQFESLFVQMMMKSMRNTLPGSSMSGGAAEETYQSLYDQQLSLSVAKGSGFGLADMLVRQLQRGSTDGATNGMSAQSIPAKQPQIDPASAILNPIAKGAESTVLDQVDLGDFGLFNSLTQDVDAVVSDELKNLPHPLATTPSIATEAAAAPDPIQLDTLSRPARFVVELMPLAERAAAKIGVAAEVLVAQAALETGWGVHVMRVADGGSSHNLFGIKAGPDWHGARTIVSTLEYRNQQPVREQAEFRAYDSFADSFEDYVNFLQTRPHYQAALDVTDDPVAFTRNLQTAGYATDPNYATKIQRILGSSHIAEGLRAVVRA